MRNRSGEAGKKLKDHAKRRLHGSEHLALVSCDATFLNHLISVCQNLGKPGAAVICLRSIGTRY